MEAHSLGFNAARGFVGGARKNAITIGALAALFQCRTRLCWWCKRHAITMAIENVVSMPHAALLVVQDRYHDGTRFDVIVSMPHAALLVVQVNTPTISIETLKVSMPHAALLVVQEENIMTIKEMFIVSMPHAALLVVQEQRYAEPTYFCEFQCRTRLCWWCKGVI